MSGYLTVGQVASELGAIPADISALIYQRRLRVDAIPLVGKQRMIPEKLVLRHGQKFGLADGG